MVLVGLTLVSLDLLLTKSNSDLNTFHISIYFNRREDREPSKHSRVCSCHFRNGEKVFGPEIFKHNKGKLFPSSSKPPPKKKKKLEKSTDGKELVDIEKMREALQSNESEDQERDVLNDLTASEIILETEVKQLRNDLQQHEEKSKYFREKYSVSTLSDDVIRMETGLPTKQVFDVVVLYTLRFKDSIIYFHGWKVESISFEDQIFITLIKIRQNYTNLHIAQLFSCSETTISNIVITFIHLLHEILFTFLMSTVPSREKNKTCLPSSFTQFSSCKIIIDCTDIEVATPGLMSHQSATYSSYRGMNSFKVLVGVAPNGVITYVSNLYPGSTSDKAIVEMSGFLKHLYPGDLVLADKGFLIQDIVPSGVSVNIPPFLNNGKFTENEIKVTKSIAKCRIHVERANARLKDFKILSFIPSYLRCYSQKIFQLCAALVNLQFPLIKEGCTNVFFE